MWYVPITFYMFSCGKRSYSAALKVSDANVSICSFFLLFSKLPLTLSICWIANCVWIVAHGYCICVYYRRYMRPLQFLLEDTRVFPVGCTKYKQKKIPLQAKIRLPVLKTLCHKQLYTTYISHLITMNISQSTLSVQLHTRSVCFPTYTPLHTPASVPNHKFKQKIKKPKKLKRKSQRWLFVQTFLSKCAACKSFFYKWRTLGASSESYVHWSQRFLENQIA